MKKIILVLVALSALLFVLKGEIKKTPEQLGKVNFMKGNAFYTLPRTEEKIPLKLNMDIPVNASISTDIASRLEIKTKDNHFIRLWESTLISCFSVKVENLTVKKENMEKTKVVISVKVGKIWNNLLKNATASRYEVSTPQGVCGVRGTIYNSTVDKEGNTNVMVFEGAVAVSPVPERIKTTFKDTFGQPYQIERPFKRIKKPYHRVTKEQWETIVGSMQMISLSADGERKEAEFSMEEALQDDFVTWNVERDKEIVR